MQWSGPHILIVDDDASVREAVTAALDDGYVVHSASTGDEACAILRAHPVAAIILDAILEDEHGLDLVGRFRTLSRAPILILTGHGTEELAIRALRARASDYLKKPVNIRELHAEVDADARGMRIHEDGLFRFRLHAIPPNLARAAPWSPQTVLQMIGP